MRRHHTAARLRFVAFVLLILTPALALALAVNRGNGGAAYHDGVLASVLFAVSLLVVAWFAAERFLLRPLHAMRSATERMAAGDLAARVMLAASPPELAKLAQHFNAMAGALQARSQELAAQEQTARSREEQLRRIVETLPDALVIADSDGRFVRVNGAAEALFGLSADEILQCSVETPSWRRLTLAGEPISPSALPFHQLKSTETAIANSEFILERPDGRRVVIALNAAALPDADGRFGGTVAVLRDITERKALEEQLKRRAAYDSLTGLPNRSLFLNRLTKALSTEEPGVSHAVLFLDLDGFKSVNDRLGHAVGDEVLATVAQRLVQCVRPEDTSARFGGDEFLLLVERVHGEIDVQAIANRVLARLSRPYQVDGHTVQLSVSIGIAIGIAGECRAEELLRQADTALYQAKAAGKAQATWYHAGHGAGAVERLDLSNDLRAAIEQAQLVLHYQPEVDIHTGAVVGVEALVRWHHPTRGLIPPTSFLTLAEEAGLTGALTQWVLETACRQLHAWEELRPDGPPLRVSINLSARQFTEPDLVRQVAHLLHEAGLHPSCLQIEIAETVLTDQGQAVEQTLAALRQLGVRIAIDNYGMGHLSLQQLQRTNADLLKLDQSLVQRLPAVDALAVLEAVATAALALGLETAAQGIETVEQLVHVEQMGCAYAQGYFLARPEDAPAAAAYLQPAYRAFTTESAEREP